MTQRELAETLGITQGAVAQLESRHANLTVDTLQRVLRALGHRLVLTAEPSPGGVDETLIRRNLRMTPAERLAAHDAAYREVQAFARTRETD
jgi:transcriptional regulator with XRE-family HTH domain